MINGDVEEWIGYMSIFKGIRADHVLSSEEKFVLENDAQKYIGKIYLRDKIAYDPILLRVKEFVSPRGGFKVDILAAKHWDNIVNDYLFDIDGTERLQEISISDLPLYINWTTSKEFRELLKSGEYLL